MRVITFGKVAMIRNLTNSLAREGIEVMGTTDRLEMMDLLERGGFDLAMINISVERVEAICRRIKRLRRIPVVLVVGNKQANWERLQSLDTDGYISEGLRPIEMAARLRAVVRRWSGWKTFS